MSAEFKESGRTLSLKLEVSTNYEALEQLLFASGRENTVQLLAVRAHSSLRQNDQLVAFLNKLFVKERGIKEIIVENTDIPVEVLCLVLSRATMAETICIESAFLLYSSLQDFQAYVNSLTTINQTIEECHIIDSGIVLQGEEDQYVSAETFQLLHAICPNVKKIVYSSDPDSQGPETELEWQMLFGGRSVREVIVCVSHDCDLSTLFRAVTNCHARNQLQKLKIDEAVMNEYDWSGFANFVGQNNPDNTLKEMHLVAKRCVGMNAEESGRFPPLHELANALASNHTLSTFRITTGNPNGVFVNNDRAVLNELGGALVKCMESAVRLNHRLVCVEVPYPDPAADEAQNIEMLLTLNRHKELLVEAGSTGRTRLLWIHTIGLFRDNLNYLFSLLQTNPSLCNAEASNARQLRKRSANRSPERHI